MTLDVRYGPHLTRDGQSRAKRFAEALDPSFVQIDGRTPRELVQFVHDYAAELQFVSPVTGNADNDWRPFFAKLKDLPEDQLTMGGDGFLEPHAALTAAFILLFRHAQGKLNSLSKAHLDFYYEQILQLTRLPSIPDRAHLLFELKKKFGPFRLDKDTAFSAGKDAGGRPLQYSVVREVVLNEARVESLRAVFVDRKDGITVRKAPVANSADGVGAPLDETLPRWKPFGWEGLPPAELGFAVASPLLAMSEGTRNVELRVTSAKVFSGVPPENAFDAYATGPKGWIGPKAVSVHLEPATGDGSVLVFSVTLSPDDPPLQAYDAAKHGGDFETGDPLLQFVLNPNTANKVYPAFMNFEVARLSLGVEAGGISKLTLKNDLGDLDPAKPFLPFGPAPVAGSSFRIGHNEVFRKELKSFSLTIGWQNVPAVNWATHYAYTGLVSSNSYFRASLGIPFAGWVSPVGVALFDPDDARNTRVLELTRTGAHPEPVRFTVHARAEALGAYKSDWAGRMKQRMGLLDYKLEPIFGRKPTFASGVTAVGNEVVLTLNQDFFHQTYRDEYTRALVAFAKTRGTDARLKELKESYTPVIQSLKLGYTAATPEVDLRVDEEEAFLSQELLFYHVAAFGQRREHGFIKRRLSFPVNPAVHLLPEYDLDGELLIGIEDLRAGSNLSLLFQTSEGTGNPDSPKPSIQWSVLSDNHWRDLTPPEILFDDTNGLLTTGIMEFAIPSAATGANTLLPAGMHWLRAGLRGQPDAACDLMAVVANAAVVERVNTDETSPQDVAQVLPGGRITKPVEPIAALKSVRQPYASYGGRTTEDDKSFYARVSERLRHKNRAVSLWDYERLVLSRFPEVYKVKCLDHTAPDSYLAPGHVTLVVIPDLRNNAARDHLRPGIDLDTRERIRLFIMAHCSNWITVHVENPDYQELLADFQVHFLPEFDAGFYGGQLNDDLEKILSPWAFDGGSEPVFGGRIHKSIVLRAVEQLHYVDYVREFHLFQTGGGTSREVTTTPAVEPRALLVSSAMHRIHVI